MGRFNPHAYGSPVLKQKSTEMTSPISSAQTKLDNTNQLNTELDSTSAKAVKPDSISNNSTVQHTRSENSKKPIGFSEPVQPCNNLLASKHASKPPSTSSMSFKPASKEWNQLAVTRPIDGPRETTGSPEMNIETCLKPTEVHTHIASNTKIKPTKAVHPTRSCKSADSFQPDCSKKLGTGADNIAVSTSQHVASSRNRASVNVPAGVVVTACDKTPLRADKENQQQMTGEKLSQAREEALKGIFLRNKAKDQSSTTSLRDLHLARQYSPNAPSANRTRTLPSSSGVQSYDGSNISKTVVSAQAGGQEHGQGVHIGVQNSERAQRRGKVFPTKVRDSHKSSAIALRPVEMEIGSSPHGSPIPSNVSLVSNESIRAQHAGKGGQNDKCDHRHPLMGWDGLMQPPPVNWDDRPRYDNDGPAFRHGFATWTQDICDAAEDSMFRPIPVAQLLNANENPDGISMVPRKTVVNRYNAEQYGYSGYDTYDAMTHVQSMESKDFEDWGKLDLSQPENLAIKHETTRELVDNWINNTIERRKIADAEIDNLQQAAQAVLNDRKVSDRIKPLLNIYLRPALRTDLSQLADIYNWYIQNSPRPAETRPVGEEEMEIRLDETRSSKLPFIVAIERNTSRAAPFDLAAKSEAFKRDPHPIKNIDLAHAPMVAQEKVVGWASAQDFSAPDYTERISVELEIYVSPSHRQLGVGACLMDRLLQACDYSRQQTHDYSFHCAPEYLHLYNSGGGRNPQKLIFVLRKWKIPKQERSQGIVHNARRAKSKKQPDDLENDYEVWLKKWLEKWNFEEEGVLKGAGAKDGRYIDVVHLSRGTAYKPDEGKVPDAMPGLF